MKKLYIGAICGISVFICFLICQNNFAQTHNKKEDVLKKQMEIEIVSNTDNKTIQKLEQKVELMEKYIHFNQKYIEVGQKNLDLWLKYLTFILSVLIGYSIFNGLKSRELAKDELKEIKSIKDGIKKVAKDAEDRLEVVATQITLIETTAENAKTIEEKMALQLKEFSDKTEITLDSSQEKKLDELISQTKEELQNNGLEAFKNLYYAKALKANNEENYEETIRLINTYIDLEENNSKAYFMRGRAYDLTSSRNTIENLTNSALLDYNEAIRLDKEEFRVYNNRGTIFHNTGKNEKALLDYNEAIRLSPDYAIAYKNRSILYKQMGQEKEAEADLLKLKEIEDKNNQT